MTRSALYLALLALLTLATPGPAFAQDTKDPDTKELVKASLAGDHDALTPGTTTHLVLRLQIKPEWHVYWLNPGDAGVPTKVELSLPKGLESAGPHWPAPERLAHEDGFVDFAYEGELLVLIPIKVQDSPEGQALVGGDVSLEVKVEWLVCKEACIPGQATLAMSLPVRAKDGKRSPQAPVVAQVKAARPRLASPLPKGVKASFSGLKLELEAPGAKGLTWFPLNPSDAGPVDLVPLAGKGPKLAVSYPAGVRKSKQVKGLLEIKGPQGATYHWVELSPPTS